MSTHIKIVLLISTYTRLGEGTYVGCNLVQAGNQPLKMNIGPSFANLSHQHLSQAYLSALIWGKPSHPFHGYKMWNEETYEVLITPAIVA
jgi:hypothetical protein